MRLFNGIGPLAVALAGITAVPAVHAQEQQTADLIVLNGKVQPVNKEQPAASAFAVRDGRFVAVGSDADMQTLRGDATRVIDAAGRTVIPGLNDLHSHAIRGGRLFNIENPVGRRSLARRGTGADPQGGPARS